VGHTLHIDVANFPTGLPCSDNVSLSKQLCMMLVWPEHNTVIQSGPKKCVHSLLINIFGINVNEISILG